MALGTGCTARSSASLLWNTLPQPLRGPGEGPEGSGRAGACRKGGGGAGTGGATRCPMAAVPRAAERCCSNTLRRSCEKARRLCNTMPVCKKADDIPGGLCAL